MPEIVQSMTIGRPLEDLAQILGERSVDWMTPFASIAVHAAEQAGDRRFGSAPRGPARSRRVNIDLTDLPPGDEVARVDVELHWRTVGFRWAFAAFEGRIVARRDSPGTSVVSLEGRYELPAAAADPAGAEAAAVAAETAATMLLRTLRDAVEEQARSGV